MRALGVRALSMRPSALSAVCGGALGVRAGARRGIAWTIPPGRRWDQECAWIDTQSAHIGPRRRAVGLRAGARRRRAAPLGSRWQPATWPRALGLSVAARRRGARRDV